jgi:hypothetical protein
MSTFVLMWFFYAPNGAMASGAGDFASKEACERAAYEWVERTKARFERAQVVTYCAPKA